MEENRSQKHPKPNENQLIAQDMLKTFYERPSSLKDENGNPFPVPHDGSLGLLALGHIGLIEWRKSREKYIRDKAQQKANELSK